MPPRFSATETTVFWDGKYCYFADGNSGAAIRLDDSHILSASWPYGQLFNPVSVGWDTYSATAEELLKAAMRYQRSDPAGHLLRVPSGFSVLWGNLEFFNIQDLIAVSPEATGLSPLTQDISLNQVRALSSDTQVKFDLMTSRVRCRLTASGFTSDKARTLEAAMDNVHWLRQ